MWIWRRYESDGPSNVGAGVCRGDAFDAMKQVWDGVADSGGANWRGGKVAHGGRMSAPDLRGRIGPAGKRRRWRGESIGRKSLWARARREMGRGEIARERRSIGCASRGRVAKGKEETQRRGWVGVGSDGRLGEEEDRGLSRGHRGGRGGVRRGGGAEPGVPNGVVGGVGGKVRSLRGELWRESPAISGNGGQQDMGRGVGGGTMSKGEARDIE